MLERCAVIKEIRLQSIGIRWRAWECREVDEVRWYTSPCHSVALVTVILITQ